MNEVTNWFTGLATIGGFLYFVAGFGSAYLFECIKAKVRHRKIKLPWHLAGIAIGIAAIIIVTLQSQAAYTTAKDTAIEVAQCQKEFNQTLRDRAQITRENDEISLEQRRVLFNWLHDIIFPPPPYNDMDVNDPMRQQWGIDRTIIAESKLSASFEKQEELQNRRDANPLPDPTCGR